MNQEARLRAGIERDLRFTIESNPGDRTPRIYKLGDGNCGSIVVRGNQPMRATLAQLYGCPGHVASDFNPRICRYCGTDIASERD
jgi:hypothetical protein